MHSGDGHFIGAIEGLGFAKLELSGFDSGQHWGGIGGWGLEGMTDAGGQVSGGVREWNTDRRDKWEQFVRNSLVEGMLSLRVNEVSSFQARVPADCC